MQVDKIPTKDAAGNPIADPIGTRINKAYADPSMKGFALVAAYEKLSDAKPPVAYLMLFFQKP